MDDEIGDYELSFAGGSQLSPDPRPKRHRAGAPALAAAGAPATPSAHPVTPESVTPSARGPAQAQRLPASAAFDPFQFPAPPPPHPGAPDPAHGPSRHHGPRTQTRGAPHQQQHLTEVFSQDPPARHGLQHQQQQQQQQQTEQHVTRGPPTHGSPGSDPLHVHLEDPTRPFEFTHRHPSNDFQHHGQPPASRCGGAGGGAGGARRPGIRAVPDPAGGAGAAAGGAGGGGADGGTGGGTLLEHLIRVGALDAWVVEDAEGSGMPRLVEGAVPLQVDVSALVQSDPQLGAQLITDPAGSLYSLLDQLHAEGISASPCPRLYVRPTQVPVPCQPIPALMASLTHLPGASSWTSVSTHHPTTPFGSEAHALEHHHGHTGPHALLACCYGVVVAASSVGLRPHSRLLACGRCGEAAAVLEERGAAGWPGCSCGEGPGVAELQEDLSGRVMVPCQDLWLAGLSSALPAGEAAHADMGAGAMGFGALPGSVRVAVGDDLAGVARVGDVVRVVGMARLLGPPGRSTTAASTASTAPSSSLYATATASIDALSMAPVHPFRMWGPPARVTAPALTSAATSADTTTSLVMRSRRPLQTLVDLVCQLQGRPIEPLPALAMLLSAVAAGGATEALGAEAGVEGAAAAAALPELGTAGRGPHPHLQALADGRIRLLVGHPASDPLCPRLLRGCAALLSPLSAALAPACAAGTALYDDPPAVMPRLVAGGRLGVDGSGQAGASGVAHGSLLLTAGNRGVAVVEAEVLTNKHRSALNELLGRPSLPLAPGRPELTTPLTTTVWAAAPRSGNALAGVDELAFSGAGGGGGGSGRRWGKGAGGGAGGGSDRALPWGGLDESQYDIVLHHVAGDDLVAVAALGEADEAGGADPFLLRALRQHMAAAAQLTAQQQQDQAGPSGGGGGGGGEGRDAATSPHPQLTEEALELLMRYYVAVRQSGVQVTQAASLGSLVRVATACARLHLRTQVLAAPDCALAVLLMEESLGCRFGDAYMRLSLPPLPDGAEGADGVEEEGQGGGGIDGALAALGPVLGRLLQGFASGGW